jgi:hypothetical protein
VVAVYCGGIQACDTGKWRIYVEDNRLGIKTQKTKLYLEMSKAKGESTEYA